MTNRTIQCTYSQEFWFPSKYNSWPSYHALAFTDQNLAQALGSVSEEGAQLTDPGETQRDTKETVQDAEHTATRRLGSHISITCNQKCDGKLHQCLDGHSIQTLIASVWEIIVMYFTHTSIYPMFERMKWFLNADSLQYWHEKIDFKDHFMEITHLWLWWWWQQRWQSCPSPSSRSSFPQWGSHLVQQLGTQPI